MKEYAQTLSCILWFEETHQICTRSLGKITPEVVEVLERVAKKDEKVLRRARQMTEMWRTPPRGSELTLAPLFPLPWGRGLEEWLSIRRNHKFEKKPYRRCTRAGCGNLESSDKKFQVCGGCMLACYCSRGKLYLMFCSVLLLS
jgi:hypothetical protein